MDSNDEFKNTEIKNQKQKTKGYLKEILGWIEAIVLAAVIALLIRAFVFEMVEVQGPSMENTLFTGQKLFVYKLGYNFHTPKKGDIIVLQYQEGLFKYLPFPDPSEIDYIKRIVGVPGDTLDIKDGYVYVNGVKQEEPFARGTTFPNGMKLPEKVPENNVFVMGDNREQSRDSRVIGFIQYDKIKGKAVIRVWPFKEFGVLH